MAGLTLPSQGGLPGKVHANQAASQAARPLNPGEYVDNPDGSWSNEITVSAQHPGLNGGKPSIIPSLWMVNGKPTRLSEDQAADVAAKSGLRFPAFNTAQEAEAASVQREAQWQTVKREHSGMVAPLWSRPPPAVPGGGLLNPQKAQGR